MTVKQRFYFEGVIYDTEEEFFKARCQFALSEITPISTERILEWMCKDIALNLFNPTGKDTNLTNNELQALSSEMTYEFINHYRKMLAEKAKQEEKVESQEGGS